MSIDIEHIEQQKIIQAFIREYFCAYYINLKDSSFIHMGSKKNVFQQDRGNINEAFKWYIRTNVNPMYSRSMLNFTDTNSLPWRMKNEEVMSTDFIALGHGWTRARWFVVSRDELGNVKTAVFAMKDIDEDRTRLLTAQQKTEEQLNKLEEQTKALEIAKKEAENANAAKSSFLFNMSHDIRTPMNAILGFAKMMEKHEGDKARFHDYLGKIKSSGKVLLELINNVLEMSRIEKGKLVVDEEVTSVYAFNDVLYNVFHDQMQEKQITFTRSIEVKDKYIYCDPSKLREVLINIISNAYKYTPQGGRVDMSLRQLPYDREGWGIYEMRITDNGMGMSKDYLPHLFEPFAREHTTTDVKIEGTGLGMSIVKHLVDIMDGTITVESEIGKGTMFVVSIPHRIAEPKDVEEEDCENVDDTMFEGKRILMAEDNDLNAEIATDILQEFGFVIERASDGKECVDMLSDAKDGYYDVILMDIQMPFMNGYEATKAIRRLEDTRKAQIPILAMTANAFEEDKREAFKAGMNGHLAKPINVQMLFSELRRVLR